MRRAVVTALGLIFIAAGILRAQATGAIPARKRTRPRKRKATTRSQWAANPERATDHPCGGFYFIESMGAIDPAPRLEFAAAQPMGTSEKPVNRIAVSTRSLNAGAKCPPRRIARTPM